MESISEMLQDPNENSIQHILIMTIIRTMAIGFCIVAFYVIAQMVNAVFGRELVVESEVIVVHDDDNDDKNKTTAATKRPRRTARAKKEE